VLFRSKNNVMVNIEILLNEKELTKQGLAKRTGISRENLYRILNGNPTLQNLEKIASALEVSIYQLFEPAKTNEFICPNCGSKLKISKA